MSSAFERLSKKSKGVSDASVGGKDRLKIESMLDFADFSDGEYRTGRIYPGLFGMATHWFDIKNKDGDPVSVGKTCKRYDPISQEFDNTKKCAVCENRDSLRSTNKFTKETGDSRLDVKYFFNFLNRDKQENLPKKLRETDEELDTGFKSKSSSSLTPIEVVRCPGGLVEKFKKLQRAGKKETKLDDPEKGRDVSIMFNKDEKTPSNMWDAQKADEPGDPLSKKEKAYLLWDIPAAIEKMQQATTYEEDLKDVEKAMADFGGKKSKNKSKDKGGKSKDEDLIEDEGKKSKDKSKKDKGSKSKSDEDDEDSGKKSKDKSKKGGKSSKDEDDDEDTGKKSKDKSKDKKKSKDEDEDEDEPKSKKSKDKGDKGGKKSKDADEDDEPKSKKDKKGKSKDADEDDEPKSKKDKKGKSKSKDKDEDDEDSGKKSKKDKGGKSKFDIDDDGDDEDDEPKSKKDKKKKK